MWYQVTPQMIDRLAEQSTEQNSGSAEPTTPGTGASPSAYPVVSESHLVGPNECLQVTVTYRNLIQWDEYHQNGSAKLRGLLRARGVLPPLVPDMPPGVPPSLPPLPLPLPSDPVEVVKGPPPDGCRFHNFIAYKLVVGDEVNCTYTMVGSRMYCMCP